MIHYHHKHLSATNIKPRKSELVASTRTPFEKLTAIHPDRRITLETGPTPISTRLMDLFVPLGFGQRALVVAPPQAGKTTILRQIAAAVIKNYPEASLFLCLVYERDGAECNALCL